jgi:hypothetical protein
MSKKQIARQHHYLPQFYLRAFAKKPSPKAKLYVFDMLKGNWLPHPTSTKGLGTRRDFNRVDMDGHPIDALENSLSKFESDAAMALRRIIESCQMPDGDDYIYLMNIVAMISVRNPWTRKNFGNFKKEIIERTIDLTLASRQRFESSVKKMKEDGYGLDLPDVSYEEMLTFYEEKNYDITIANQSFFSAEFGAIDTVIKTLLKRKWTFLIADNNAGYFVCGDDPMCLRWNSPNLDAGNWPPGHGLKNTEVIFPLSKNIAMVGTFDGKDRTVKANRTVVATLNTILINNCDRHVYSPKGEFDFIGTDQRIYQSNSFCRWFRRRLPLE